MERVRRAGTGTETPSIGMDDSCFKNYDAGLSVIGKGIVTVRGCF